MHFRKIYVFAFCVMFTILVTSCGADNQTSEININNITENKTENKTEKEISGIVALNAYRQNSKMVYEIYSINPESGETELFSTFSDDTSEEYVHDKWFSYDQWGSTKFSSDYLKMAKDEYGSGGHQFAGWVDSKNNFINVYKEIFGEPESDFYTITSKAYGFDSNDYFYFNVDGKYYKVPSDNLSKDALIDISDKVSYSFDKGYYSVDSYILTGDSSTIHNLYEMWGSSDYIVTDCLESRVLGFEAKKQYEQVYVPRIQDYIDTEDI